MCTSPRPLQGSQAMRRRSQPTTALAKRSGLPTRKLASEKAWCCNESCKSPHSVPFQATQFQREKKKENVCTNARFKSRRAQGRQIKQVGTRARCQRIVEWKVDCGRGREDGGGRREKEKRRKKAGEDNAHANIMVSNRRREQRATIVFRIKSKVGKYNVE